MTRRASPRLHCTSDRELMFELLEARQLLSVTTVDSQLVTPDLILPDASRTSPSGYSPSQILNAYGFNQVSFTNSSGAKVAANGAGETIAIVDAYNDPFITSNLATFDAKYGIAAPPSLKIENENGGTSLPAMSVGWAGEIALDVEWVHAIAPGANILLVEASSANSSDLDKAEDTARNTSGVVVISNSWGGSQYNGESSEDAHFVTPTGHAGETFVVAAGDDGADAEYPSSSPNVLSAGGTSLTLTSSGAYASESAWSEGGGGVSLYEGKPSYQTSTLGKNRMTPDVSADANPSTGVEVYDSFGGGWYEVGGTSAAAPQWAGLIAIVDQGRALAGKSSLSNAQAALYSMPGSDFHDVTSGSNGDAAGKGYDLATGLGTPIANLLIPGLVSFSGSTSFTVAGVVSSGGGSSGGGHGGGRGGGFGGLSGFGGSGSIFGLPFDAGVSAGGDAAAKTGGSETAGTSAAATAGSGVQTSAPQIASSLASTGFPASQHGAWSVQKDSLSTDAATQSDDTDDQDANDKSDGVMLSAIDASFAQSDRWTNFNR